MNYLQWSVQELLAALLTEVKLREDHCLNQHGSSEGRKVLVIAAANALFSKERRSQGMCLLPWISHTGQLHESELLWMTYAKGKFLESSRV